LHCRSVGKRVWPENKAGPLDPTEMADGPHVVAYCPAQARLRSPARQTLLGFSGSYTQDPTVLSNEYFSVLLGNTWEPHTSALGKPEFVAVSSTSLAASAADSDDIDGSLPLYMLPSDLALVHDPELLAIAEEYASDSMAFLGEFFNAWSKVVNADRFDIDCSD